MIVLAACQGVTTEFTPFHTFSAASPPQGKTFILLPGPSQEGSLEWAQYSNLVAQRLQSKGLRQVDSIRGADYAVSLTYAIDRGRTTSTTMANYGQTSPGRTTYTTTSVGRSSVTTQTYTPPTYGVTGYSTYTGTVYDRGIRIAILDVQQTLAQDKPVLVYEATGKSEGSSGNINEVLPSIIDAMFVDWPGRSGVTQTHTK